MDFRCRSRLGSTLLHCGRASRTVDFVNQSALAYPHSAYDFASPLSLPKPLFLAFRAHDRAPFF